MILDVVEIVLELLDRIVDRGAIVVADLRPPSDAGASCKTPRWRGLMGNRPALASGLCVDGEVKLWRSYVSSIIAVRLKRE